MRILGIDPGSLITGYACLEAQPGMLDPTVIEAGAIRLDRRTPVSARIGELFRDLEELIERLRPARMVVERLYSHYAHPQTAVKMAHARGVILLAAQRRGVEIHETAATEIKKAITGSGHASKSQIQHAVTEQLRLGAIPEPPDVADALAIALTAARRLALDPVGADGA